MSENHFPEERLWKLTEAVCSETISEVERAELQRLLQGNPAAQRFYLQYCRLHAELRYLHRPQQAQQQRLSSSPSSDLITGEPATPMLPEYNLPWEKPRPKVVIETSPPKVIPWYSVNSPIGLPLIAYTLGAIIMLIAIGIGAVVQVTHNYEIAATQTVTSEEDSGGDGGFSGALATAEKAKPKKEEAPFVGHISGMVDCRWAGPSLKPIAPRIRQGAKFALESGLMEITYTTGAKVILQGPCTYEVESPHGGYLALGKLTARVASGQWPVTSAQSPAATQKSEIRNQKSAISKSPNLQISKFVVRTPTATVTDLGTEFGVEVFESGETASHVFSGIVKLEIVGGGAGQDVVLQENESALIEKSGGEGGAPKATVRRCAVQPERFVRKLPTGKKYLPVYTLAYFRLGEDDPGAADGQPANDHTVNHRGKWHLEKYGSPSYTAKVAAPGSTLAVSFTGTNHECFYRRDLFQSPMDNFILEAWVRPNRVVRYPSYIVHNGAVVDNGYGIVLGEDGWVVHVPNVETRRLGIPYSVGRWVHVALVRDNCRLQLWLDGRLAKDLGETLVPLLPGGPFLIGGAPEEVVPDPKNAYTFDGQIDEVRLSEFRGPFQPEMLLLHPEMLPQAESPERREK